jgi:predicted DNA-binding protein (MmcQ/YjbR family)
MKDIVKSLLDHCLSKPGAYIDYPFGDIPVCVKVGKRLFAQVYPNDGDLKITLNCDMMSGEFFRSMYPGTVVRGYHCPPQLAPYFNTIYINGIVPEAELKMMIDLSYTTVFNKLTRKAQCEISAAASQ